VLSKNRQSDFREANVINRIELIENTGMTVSCRLMSPTGSVYDVTQGSFVASPTNPDISFTESAYLPGHYSAAVPTAILNDPDNVYTIVIYDTTDSTHVPIAGGELRVKFGMLQTKLSPRGTI
jgi:hypothetical protein